jgi:hypothetical protein
MNPSLTSPFRPPRNAFLMQKSHYFSRPEKPNTSINSGDAKLIQTSEAQMGSHGVVLMAVACILCG